jgi:hypothetical protein
MPSTTRAQKATPNAAPVNKETVEQHIKQHVAPNQMVLSKNAGGNISEYPIEFTKDSK